MDTTNKCGWPIVVVSLLLLLACSRPSGLSGGVEAVAISGEGPHWSKDVYDDLGSLYAGAQDDAAITYTNVSYVDLSLSRLSLGSLAFASTSALVDASKVVGGKLHSIPMMASALAIGYDAAHFGNSSDSNKLVLGVDTLVAIWSGEVTSWNDPAIADLNRWLTLPAGNISLVFCDQTEGDVIRRFLVKAGPASLASQLLSATGGFSSLPPVAAGRALSVCSPQDIMATAANLSASIGQSLVFVMAPELPPTRLASALLRPAAAVANGSESVSVGPTSSAVLNAMKLAGAADDIVNTGANASWPLSTLVSLLVKTDLTSVNNCYKVKYVLEFASWVQLNSAATALLSARDSGYTALDSGHRRTTLDRMRGITCNGGQVVTTTYLLGSGPVLPCYPPLATAFKYSNDVDIKYYASTSSAQAFIDMIDSSYDFASTGLSLTAPQRQLLPDAVLVPMIAYGSIFSYNIPELLYADALVLSLQLVADVLMGNIEYWDDRRICALNPDIVHLLPHRPIIVLYFETPQVLTQVTNTLVSFEVPEYRQAVGNSSLGSDYPIVAKARDRTRAMANQSAIWDTFEAIPYAFGPSNTFITFTMANTRAVSLTGNFSSGKIIAPTDANIISAITNSPSSLDQQVIYMAPGDSSWPLVCYNSLIVHTREMADCTKAAALADWIYWVQTDSAALDILNANQIVRAGSSSALMSRILDEVVSITCHGYPVSSLAGCVEGGAICSHRGTCGSGSCQCDAGWTGPFCELPVGSSSGTPTYAIVLASALPAAFIVALVALCGAALAFYLGHRRRPKVILKEPNYQMLVWRRDSMEGNEVRLLPMRQFNVKVREVLIEFLMDKHVVRAVGTVAHANPSSIDEVAAAMVLVHQSANRGAELVRLLLHSELLAHEGEDDFQVLFREESPGVNAFSVFSRMVGLPYLWRTFAYPIAELEIANNVDAKSPRSNLVNEWFTDLKLSVTPPQINPKMMEEGQDCSLGRLQLELLVQKLFTRILDSITYFPLYMRQLCRMLYEDTRYDHPEHIHRVLGNLVFLRFICPALLVPQTYGLVKAPTHPQTLRTLILITKTLQNLANKNEFGAKEQFMEAMNGFIHRNMAKLEGFFDELCAPAADPTFGQPQTSIVPRQFRQKALMVMYQFVHAHARELEAELREFPPFAVQEALERLHYLTQCDGAGENETISDEDEEEDEDGHLAVPQS